MKHRGSCVPGVPREHVQHPTDAALWCCFPFAPARAVSLAADVTLADEMSVIKPHGRPTRPFLGTS